MAVTSDALNWWTDVVVPFGAAVIGATAAIVGGVLAARYEGRQTRTLAIQLRAQEREEERLLRLGPMVAEIRSRMESFLGWFKRDPARANPHQPAELAEGFRDRLLIMWQAELVWRVRDERVGRAVADLLNALESVAEGGSTGETELQQAVDMMDKLGAAIRQALESPSSS